ncbi:MAG: hypothetical protein JWO82_2806 [Akkermansiaceae bacterium]|nr:hypothetical protein [Akkermansiaceae bacterium]
MNEAFLRYYEDELRHVREMAAEFGALHPLVAGQLRLRTDGCEDPFVERLLEGFAFLAARVHQKLDSDFPVFTQSLLETVYPAMLSPVPSMGIVEIHPDEALTESLVVPRGASLTGHLGADVDTRCEFRTAHDVTVHPFGLARDTVGRSRYFDRDLDILRLPAGLPVKGALRLRLEMTKQDATFASLKEIDELTFFIRGDVGGAGRIHEEIFSQATHLFVADAKGVPGRAMRTYQLGEPGGPRIVPGGFSPEEAMLPVESRVFEGYRLLREYMGMPQRFLFFKLQGLARALAGLQTTSVDLILGFKRGAPEMANLVRPETFVLNATPVINLFERRADHVALDRNRSEFHLVVDRTKPLHHEVLTVQDVAALMHGSSVRSPFLPFYRCGVGDPSARAFYTVRREPRILSSREKREGPSSRYLGSEVYLSLVDGRNAPYRDDADALAVRVLCSNRHLPLSMPLSGRDTDLLPEGGQAISSVRWLVPPTAPMDSLAEGSNAWRFVSHLSLNYLSLVEDAGKGIVALRDLLRIYMPPAMEDAFEWIDGIASVTSKHVIRRMPGGGPVAFQRGLAVEITFDERRFAGASAFLCGSVLARFLAHHVTINSFVETSLLSSTRGRLVTWPPLTGTRALA